MSRLNQVKLTTAFLPSDVLEAATIFNNCSMKEASPLGNAEVEGQAWLG